jgi:uncharacterized protein with HEPN domain
MKENRVYLLHIRDAIERIESYTKDGRDAFMSEPMIQDAVIRNLEIIGEAVKSLSAEFRLEHPQLPWSKIAGLRDVLIHEYFGIHLETVWEVVGKRIPELKEHVLLALQ